MTCNSCVEAITKFLEGNPFVFDFEVILKKKRVNCIHNTDPEKIMEGIRAVGKTTFMISNVPVPGGSAHTTLKHSEEASDDSDKEYQTPEEQEQENQTKTVILSVSMYCQSCVEKISAWCGTNPNVEGFDISLEEKTVQITHDTDNESIMEGIASLNEEWKVELLSTN